MFGYITVNKSLLSEEALQNYQYYYCGLCQELKDIAGIKGQLSLNYDSTFLSILLNSLYELNNTEKHFTCFLHPLSKKKAYITEATHYVAAINIILCYHKMMDNYKDDNSKLSKKIADTLTHKYSLLKQQYIKPVQVIEDYISSLTTAENNKETNIELLSNLTGECLSKLFCWKDDIYSKDLANLGFYLGKFIYIMDAYEDLEKDKKHGKFNPLIRIKESSQNEYETFVKAHLTCLIAECAKSFERLPILENTEILRNILYSGVWTKYEYLQTKNKKQ